MKKLYTKRLVLRNWKEDDNEALYEIAKNPKIGLNVGWMPHKSINESKDVLNKIILKEKNTFAITKKEENIPIGSISLKDYKTSCLDIKENEMEMGFYLSEQNWHKGYMTEAAREVIRYAFEQLNIQKIWCCYFMENDASMRVQERLGFKYHHVNKKRFILSLNKIKDQVVNVMEQKDFNN